MRQTIPYSQQEQNRTYHHHCDATSAGRTFHYAWHRHRNVNGYYANRPNHHYQSSQVQRPIPTYPTSFSWAPPGKRKFEESESESSTKDPSKPEAEPRQKEQKPSTSIHRFNPGYQTSYRSYERNNLPKRQYGMQNHGYASSRATYNTKLQGSWQASSTNQYYSNENTPPATTSSESSGTTTEQDLTCKGCLKGKDMLHLKLFHGALTQAIYSNTVEPTDIMARQIPGCALVHDGLCFGFEKDPRDGTKLLVVRGTGCLGMALPNHQKCQVCERQQSHVEDMMQKVVAHHSSESPECLSISDIKMVPTLAEAKMRQMECEIQDYKDNSITVVNV